MKISQVGQLAGLPVKTIRFYEAQGLLSPVERAANGYRQYSQTQVNQLQFIQRCRAAGFSLDECRQMMDLASNQQRHSKDVKRLVIDKIALIEQQITTLQQMQNTLQALADRCSGDEGARCAILEALCAQSPTQQNLKDS
ncbi:Cu(I)-responsive transcriptional regulator [Saccharobesus litoralis]|uniref:HTH-type transcriptional regulator CueR n=1 Tax=Saccharobesus litoralis TaxID=2172099 RepID=A0A2S0VX19_9ALTE|nr:Cu(I)-responsive transcriptional regulator [Saccharobesus litoralis]AWB68777.1 Cu(I)-responsive transcriptional regulator [Saccharobesus litoralis]